MPTTRVRHDTDDKQRVLTHETPSLAASISDAVVIKDGNVFLLTERSGSVPLDGRHGLGLYYRDCRYRDGCVLLLGGLSAELLVADDSAGDRAVVQLANPALRGTGGDIEARTLGITWELTART